MDELERLQQALIAAHEAGDIPAAQALAGAMRQIMTDRQAPEQPPGFRRPDETPAQFRARIEGMRDTVQPSPASQEMTAQAEADIGMRVPLSYRLQDNIVGIDDGNTSFGEGLGTLLNMGGESMTFGLVGDEAAAAADSMIGRGTYDERLGFYRENEAQMREDHPWLSLAADVAPLLIPATAAGKGIGLLGTTAGRVATGFVGGGLLGGTQGFMEGEGGFNNRVNNMPLPAITAAIGGAAMEPIAMAAGATWRALGPGVASTARAARERLGLNETAARIAGDAIERDAPYVGDQLSLAGPNAVNAQIGPNTQGLLDWIANRPGEAGAFINRQVNDIAESAGQRFTGVLDTVLGRPNGVTRTQRDIMQTTAAERREAYGDAYEQIIDFATPQGQRIEELLAGVPEDVIRRAERLMRAEGNRSAQIKVSVADDGTVTFTSLPDVRTIDYITRALRDQGGFGTGEGKDAGSAFTRLASQLRGTLDEIVPEYGAARAAGRDAIVNREAVQFGSNLFRNTPMDVAEDVIAVMGPAELRFARQGLRDYIDGVMARVKPALTDRNMDAREALAPLRDILSRDGQTKLAALLGPEEATTFIKEAQEAFSALSLRASVARNSATAPRQIAEALLDENVPRTFGEALEGGAGLLGSIATATRPLIDSAAATRALRKDEVTSQIARALLSPVRTMPDNALMIQQLAPALRAGDQMAGQVAQTTRGLLGLFGTAAANQMAQQP